MIQIAGGILLAVFLLLTAGFWVPLLPVILVIGAIIWLGVILIKAIGGGP